MEVEKGKTAKYLREKQGVPPKAIAQQKEFQRVKRLITKALEDGALSVDTLATKIDMSYSDTLYHLMSLVKYGFVQIGEIDDMDEYYTYKLIK